MKTLMQCSSMCLRYEADCHAFTVQPQNSGLICEVIKNVVATESIAGVHTYCLPRESLCLNEWTETTKENITTHTHTHAHKGNKYLP